MSANLRYVLMPLFVILLGRDVVSAQNYKPSVALQERVLESVSDEKDLDVRSYKREVLNIADKKSRGNDANKYDKIDAYDEIKSEVEAEIKSRKQPAPQYQYTPEYQYTYDTYSFIESDNGVENNSYLQPEGASVNVRPTPAPEITYYDDIEDIPFDEEKTEEEPKEVTIATVVEVPAILRTSPSRDSGRIYALNLGESLVVKQQRGKWYQVEAGRIKAWIPADVVQVTNFLNSL